MWPARLQVIDAKASEPQRQFQAADRVKLLGMHFDPEAVLKRTCEHRLRLRGIPRLLLDKNIHRLRKAATGRLRNQLTPYLIQIGISLACLSGWNMNQQRRHNPYGKPRSQRSYHFQHAKLAS